VKLARLLFPEQKNHFSRICRAVITLGHWAVCPFCLPCVTWRQSIRARCQAGTALFWGSRLQKSV